MRAGAYNPELRKRADKDHTHKKLVRKQKQHLKAIKTRKQLRLIVLGSRHLKGNDRGETKSR